MGTITQRKNKKGDTKYSAQIRLRRNGVIVYQEAQSFDRKQSAQAWLRRRETELAEPGAIDEANRTNVTVKEMIDRYLLEYEKIRPLGKTKRATLTAISLTWLGALQDKDLTSQRIVEFASERMQVDGVQAQTGGNDLSHLGAVLSVARPAWGYQVDQHAMADARKVLKKLL